MENIKIFSASMWFVSWVAGYDLFSNYRFYWPINLLMFIDGNWTKKNGKLAIEYFLNEGIPIDYFMLAGSMADTTGVTKFTHEFDGWKSFI